MSADRSDAHGSGGRDPDLVLPTGAPSAGVPPFPGAIGVSHIRVYDTEAPDGLRGGTPHVHSVCTEAYYVIAGTGRVQTLTTAGFQETELEPGAFVWFTPGTIHRLINPDGTLEILVLMQNAGLPEAGDLVITFPPDVLADADAYARAAMLPPGDQTTAGPGDAARARRDLAVDGFGALRSALDAGDPQPLRQFYRQAVTLLGPRAESWFSIWRTGPAEAISRTSEQIHAVAAGEPRHLWDASVHRLAPPPEERRWGCCGVLGTYVTS